MPKIIQLDRHVADLIAAGEVVERPASAVKELVENSIDAGAKNITIELQNGGMTFLRITDDGCGMEPVDARTAFLRHATSKIRKKEDLACIGTLGFRGEALAAISSVSKIDLLTRAQGAENGVRLHLEAGQVLSEEPAGCPCGTTILVRELFYNTPARMKFMKSDAAESSAVFSVVQQQALAHPEISFRFLKDGQEQLHTDGQGNRMAAIYAIYGRELANNMLPVDGSWEKLRVRGFVTKPTATRGNRAWQSFFVNNRYIKSRLLSAAVEEAYRNQIMVGRFPACVLEIDMPVQAVDVNVHPAKTEVKFLSEREVFDAVHYAVLSTLSRAAGRPEWKTPEKKQEPAPQPQSQPKAVQPPKPGFYQTMQASEYRRQAAQQPVQKPAQPVLASPVQLPRSEPVPAQQSFTLQKPEVRPEPKPEPKIEVRLEPKPEPVKEPEAQQALSVPEEPFRIIGEALHTYIIVEQGEAVLFLDKHAAHERIRFEALKKEDHPIMAQLLLAPVSAELSREEAAAVLENRALLERCGFETEDFGGGDVLIRQIPSDVDVEDAKALLQELAGDLLAGKTLDPDSLRDNLLHTIACKSAIKAGWQTSDEELQRLVQEVLSRDDIKYCPHGRPVCVTLTKRQLEKQFKRV
ncbi:MAG: DNA mismatch repair endonuclease MutL [Oscillospiraceae bacterium]